MKPARVLATLTLLTGLAAPAAFAADAAASAPGGAAAAACAQDVKTLCPGVQPGEGRIMACLRPQRDKLSEGCKAALKAERRQHRKEGAPPA